MKSLFKFVLAGIIFLSFLVSCVNIKPFAQSGCQKNSDEITFVLLEYQLEDAIINEDSNIKFSIIERSANFKKDLRNQSISNLQRKKKYKLNNVINSRNNTT